MPGDKGPRNGTKSGGMSSSTETPANAGLGGDKPKTLDAEGAVGKQFTGGNISNKYCHAMMLIFFSSPFRERYTRGNCSSNRWPAG